MSAGRIHCVTDANPSDLPGEPARTIVSLLLVIHLFCLATVLSANLAPSPLQLRLVETLAPYTRLICIDPDSRRYHLTHAVPDDDDHLLDVTLSEEGNRSVVFPDVGWRGSPRRERYQALAELLAFFARRDGEESAALLARSAGRAVMIQEGATRAVVRCRRRRPQPTVLPPRSAANPPDPRAEEYLEDVYTADVWIDPDGSVQLVRRVTAREVAPAVPAKP